MIRTLKEFKIRRSIKKALSSPRESSHIKLSNAKSIGILFSGHSASLLDELVQFIKEFESQGISIQVLNYVQERRMDYIYKFPLFSDEDLSYFLIPENTSVNTFLSKNYDLIVDFSKETSLPLDFVLAKSRSKRKVGYYRPLRENYYDVMIQLNEEDSPKNMIKNLKHYLNL